MLETIARLSSHTLPDWHRWLQQQPVTDLLHSRYAKGRQECYYGLGITLQTPPAIYPAGHSERVHRLGDRLLPGWDSALLCKYHPGTGINPHRDHACFTAEAVMVNFGQAIFVEYPSREPVKTALTDGEIVRLDTKILHAVLPVDQLRYSLTFRRLKPAYLPTAGRQLSFPISVG